MKNKQACRGNDALSPFHQEPNQPVFLLTACNTSRISFAELLPALSLSNATLPCPSLISVLALLRNSSRTTSASPRATATCKAVSVSSRCWYQPSTSMRKSDCCVGTYALGTQFGSRPCRNSTSSNAHFSSCGRGDSEAARRRALGELCACDDMCKLGLAGGGGFRRRAGKTSQNTAMRSALTTPFSTSRHSSNRVGTTLLSRSAHRKDTSCTGLLSVLSALSVVVRPRSTMLVHPAARDERAREEAPAGTGWIQPDRSTRSQTERDL